MRGAGDSPLVWDEAQERAVPAAEARQPALDGAYVVKGIAFRPAYALLRAMLAPTPDAVADKVGLAAARIIELARRYATTKPARIFTLYGIDRWHHGATFGRLIATLAALTGNVGIPGGGAVWMALRQRSVRQRFHLSGRKSVPAHQPGRAAQPDLVG